MDPALAPFYARQVYDDRLRLAAQHRFTRIQPPPDREPLRRRLGRFLIRLGNTLAAVPPPAATIRTAPE